MEGVKFSVTATLMKLKIEELVQFLFVAKKFCRCKIKISYVADRCNILMKTSLYASEIRLQFFSIFCSIQESVKSCKKKRNEITSVFSTFIEMHPTIEHFFFSLSLDRTPKILKFVAHPWHEHRQAFYQLSTEIRTGIHVQIGGTESARVFMCAFAKRVQGVCTLVYTRVS